MDHELEAVLSLFFDDTPVASRLIDTSRDDADFRATFIVEMASAGKVVLKLADNDSVTTAQGSSGADRAISPSWITGDTDARRTPKSLRRSIPSKTGFRRTSVKTRRCMTGICRTFGG